jgi:hypothetical protein
MFAWNIRLRWCGGDDNKASCNINDSPVNTRCGGGGVE